MTKKDFTLDESIVLIVDALTDVPSYNKNGYRDHATSKLEEAKNMIDETIEELEEADNSE